MRFYPVADSFPPGLPMAEYREFFDGKFELQDGCLVIVHPNWQKPRKLSGEYDADSARLAKHENENNKQYFSYDAGANALQRWEGNRALALGVRDYWQLRLAREFPGREMVMLVLNEVEVAGEPPYRVEAVRVACTLRMWSAENDPQGELRKGFSGIVDPLNEMVHIENYTLVGVHRDKVFTKTGNLRKSYVQMLSQLED